MSLYALSQGLFKKKKEKEGEEGKGKKAAKISETSAAGAESLLILSSAET